MSLRLYPLSSDISLIIRETSPAAWSTSGSSSCLGLNTTSPVLLTVVIAVFVAPANVEPMIPASPILLSISSGTYAPPCTAVLPITRPSCPTSCAPSLSIFKVAPPPLTGSISIRPDAIAAVRSLAVASASKPFSSFSSLFSPIALVMP